MRVVAFGVTKPFLIRPRFDLEYRAIVRGRCAVCRATTSATVVHGKPEPLTHCARIWASFNGLDLVYNGEESMPPVAAGSR
jgi:hypothetical protein